MTPHIVFPLLRQRMDSFSRFNPWNFCNRVKSSFHHSIPIAVLLLFFKTILSFQVLTVNCDTSYWNYFMGRGTCNGPWLFCYQCHKNTWTCRVESEWVSERERERAIAFVNLSCPKAFFTKNRIKTCSASYNPNTFYK